MILKCEGEPPAMEIRSDGWRIQMCNWKIISFIYDKFQVWTLVSSDNICNFSTSRRAHKTVFRREKKILKFFTFSSNREEEKCRWSFDFLIRYFWCDTQQVRFWLISSISSMSRYFNISWQNADEKFLISTLSKSHKLMKKFASPHSSLLMRFRVLTYFSIAWMQKTRGGRRRNFHRKTNNSFN